MICKIIMTTYGENEVIIEDIDEYYKNHTFLSKKQNKLFKSDNHFYNYLKCKENNKIKIIKNRIIHKSLENGWKIKINNNEKMKNQLHLYKNKQKIDYKNDCIYQGNFF